MTRRTPPPSGRQDSTAAGEEPGSGKPQQRELHRNPWFSVWLRNGFYTVEYLQPQVIILPVVEDAGVVMVRVKRPVVDDTPLELPAGGIEPGESSAAGAAREFSEETGIPVTDITRFVPMPSLSPSPNRMPQPIHVFRVNITREEFEARGPHDSEIALVECVPLGELARRVILGEIYTIAPAAVIGAFLLSKAAVLKIQT